MLSVKLTRTVNGIATRRVGTIDTRAIAHEHSTVSRHWNGRRNSSRETSVHSEKKSPKAANGVASFVSTVTPSPLFRRTYHARYFTVGQMANTPAEKLSFGSRPSK